MIPFEVFFRFLGTCICLQWSQLSWRSSAHGYVPNFICKCGSQSFEFPMHQRLLETTRKDCTSQLWVAQAFLATCEGNFSTFRDTAQAISGGCQVGRICPIWQGNKQIANSLTLGQECHGNDMITGAKERKAMVQKMVMLQSCHFKPNGQEWRHPTWYNWVFHAFEVANNPS